LNASYEELAAPKGTNAWIDDSLRAWSQAADKLAEGKAPKVPKQDVALILKRFHEEAKSATGEDWEFWCQTISSLKQLSIKDSSAADLIAARCMDQSLPQYGTCWVLERYGRSELRSFVRARLRFILDASEEAKAFAGESGNLFATLEDSEPDKVSFVREGVVHPNAKIREAAIRSLQILSKDEGKEFLRRALVDSSEGVRFSAILEIKNFCTRAGFEWLNAALEKETDTANRRYLSEKVQDLKQD